MVDKVKHGGARPNAGRKSKGFVRVGVFIDPDALEKLDRIRGGKTRGEWIGEKVRRAREK